MDSTGRQFSGEGETIGEAPDTVAVTLPSMGESVAEGIVARWVKAVGDPVKEGETVVEVTTDKVDVEVPAPACRSAGRDPGCRGRHRPGWSHARADRRRRGSDHADARARAC